MSDVNKGESPEGKAAAHIPVKSTVASTQRDVKLLKRMKVVLDKLMADPHTRVEIRLTDLYDHLRRDPALNEALPTPNAVSKFLRAQHRQGVMKQMIPNYRVDTSVYKKYQWFFFKEKK